MEDIRFDDVEKLRSKISDTFGDWSEPAEVSQEMINRFAELTGDHQWIHVDVERARRESPFKTTIAHGFLTLSLLPTLRGKPDWKLTGYGNATNYGADKLRFVSPVPAGVLAPGLPPARNSSKEKPPVFEPSLGPVAAASADGAVERRADSSPKTESSEMWSVAG